MSDIYIYFPWYLDHSVIFGGMSSKHQVSHFHVVKESICMFSRQQVLGHLKEGVEY